MWLFSSKFKCDFFLQKFECDFPNLKVRRCTTFAQRSDVLLSKRLFMCAQFITPPETPRTITALSYWGAKTLHWAPITPRDASFLGSGCKRGQKVECIYPRNGKRLRQVAAVKVQHSNCKHRTERKLFIYLKLFKII